MGNPAGNISIRQFSRAYTGRNNRTAFLHSAATIAGFCAAVIGAMTVWGSPLITAPLMIIAALAGIRLYMLQHECGHGSLFAKRWQNTAAGRVMAVFTLCPFGATTFNHNLHHAFIGNLDHRESSEIFTMTLAEYRSAPIWKRIGYRAYRSPVTLWIIGPFLMTMLVYRLPKNWRKAGAGDLAAHNLAWITLWAALFSVFSWPALWVLLGTVALAGIWGAFIPYVQHNFEDVYWENHPDVDFETAALQGSAVIDLGPVYDFLTLNIAYHDLHHLNSQIPFYHLKRCHADMQPMLNSRRIGIVEIVQSLRWKLWDEETGRMVPFPSRETQSQTVITS